MSNSTRKFPHKFMFYFLLFFGFLIWRDFFFKGSVHTRWGFPGGASGKEPTCQCRRLKRWGLSPWVGKIPWRRAWQPTPVVLPGESHGQRSLVGYSPWGHKELDMTEWLFMQHAHIRYSYFLWGRTENDNGFLIKTIVSIPRVPILFQALC